MDLRDLVRALLGFDTLAVRQWIADAQRSGFVWAEVPAPVGLDATELATAAGVAELLAARIDGFPCGGVCCSIAKQPGHRRNIYISAEFTASSFNPILERTVRFRALSLQGARRRNDRSLEARCP